MSLIKCPECNKEISDKSEVCIHCGYPIKQNNICKINGKEYDLSFLLDDSYSILFKVRDIIQISGSDISHVKPEVEKIVQTKTIPTFLNFPIKKNENSDIPHCPTCGSTNIEKISFGKKAFGGAMFGIFSSDVRNTMHCKNCGAKC